MVELREETYVEKSHRRARERRQKRIQTALVMAFIVAAIVFIVIVLKPEKESPVEPITTPTVPTTATASNTYDYTDARVVEGKNYTLSINNLGNITEVNVRSEADKNSTKLGTLPVGFKFKVYRYLAKDNFIGVKACEIGLSGDDMVWIHAPYVSVSSSDRAELLDDPSLYEKYILPLEYIHTDRTEVTLLEPAGVFSMPAEPSNSRYGILPKGTTFTVTKIVRMDNYIYLGFKASELPKFETPDGDIEADPDGLVWIYNDKCDLIALYD